MEIPASVKEIGFDAFFKCTRLKNVVFTPESRLETIGLGSFSSTGIQKIVIPKSVTEIKEGAFYQCKELREVVFEAGSQLEKIGSGCFQNSGLEEIMLPKTLKKINQYAFYHCKDLRIIYVEDGCDTVFLYTGMPDSTKVGLLPKITVCGVCAWDLRT